MRVDLGLKSGIYIYIYIYIDVTQNTGDALRKRVLCLL